MPESKKLGQGLLGSNTKSKPVRQGPHQVSSLRKICTDFLIEARDSIRDVGEIPSVLLRPVLAACSMQQLKCVETETRLGSGRNLKWDTWDLWRRHYLHDFGEPGSKAPPIMCPKPKSLGTTVEAISEQQASPADWRKLYEETAKAMLNKTETTALRMRERYEAAKELKQKKTAKIDVEDIPATKRSRTVATGGRGSQWAASGPQSSKDRLKSKLKMKTHGESYRGVATKTKSAYTSAGNIRKQQLDQAKPVNKKRSPLNSPSPVRKKAKGQVQPSVRAKQLGAVLSSGNSSSPSLSQPCPIHTPVKKAPVRMDVGSLISGMKSSIKKRGGI